MFTPGEVLDDACAPINCYRTLIYCHRYFYRFGQDIFTVTVLPFYGRRFTVNVKVLPFTAHADSYIPSNTSTTLHIIILYIAVDYYNEVLPLFNTLLKHFFYIVYIFQVFFL